MGWQTRLDQLDFANLTTILANDPGTSSAIIIPEGSAIGRPRYAILEWFSAFLSPSVELPEDLAALAEALDILDSDQRANFLATFDETGRAFSGRPAEAIAPLKLAIQLSPVDPMMAQFPELSRSRLLLDGRLSRRARGWAAACAIRFGTSWSSPSRIWASNR
jgi:hypothetical protein